ncbi:GntR family transcriptional regulator [Variovorax sp. Sphag1AA]|uniref:GntR family transcriptional regulator n=1 Tax=Variovorax sp. Sphag1AA TaxID=2587027 RepID=UPI001C8610C6|nr:GntR family transcriptional regulator [Variovorax sp. Sphag1AA]
MSEGDHGQSTMTKTSTLDIADIQPMERETLQARVYRELRQLLMVGRFRPGQVLKIRDLAEVFATSMQPIRESIRQLIAERALEAAANSSARVPNLNVAQLEDLRLVRLAVEGLAAERATLVATPADVKDLMSVVDAELEADQRQLVEASVSRNLEFHFRLYRLSGSQELLSIIEGLWLRLGPVIREAAENFDAREGKGAAHHSAMLAALRRNDAAKVRQSVERDINHFFDLAVRRLEQAEATKRSARRRAA